MALSLGRVVSGTPVRAAELNQIIDFLEGASGENIALLLRAAAASDVKIVLADAAGVREFQILDSAEATVFSVDSDGNVTQTGTFSPSTFILPGEASPAQTALGSLRFDTDDFRLTVGTGAGRVTFFSGAPAVPGLVPVAVDTAEYTVANTAPATMVTISGLNIPATTPVTIRFNYRKSAGAAQVVKVGLVINGTTIFNATNAGVEIATSSAVNQAESGFCEVYIGPRRANYPTVITNAYHTRVNATGANAAAFTHGALTPTALVPIAAITSIALLGNSVDALQTLGVQDIQVFTHAVSVT